jgi:hypothetical protein
LAEEAFLLKDRSHRVMTIRIEAVPTAMGAWRLEMMDTPA